MYRTDWGDSGESEDNCAHFDRAWGGVLAKLKECFNTAPQDCGSAARALMQVPR